MSRPPPAALAGTAGLVAADALWLLAARPPGVVLLVPWFAGVALFGCFLGGLANQVTIARAHLAAPGLVYALQPSALGPLAVVVAMAGLTDVVDGAIARRLDRTTRLGGALDPVVDGIFFGAVAVGLAAGGAFPAWLAAVVVLRYLLPAAAGGLLLLAGRRPQLSHTPAGQVSTALIAVLLGGLALLRGWGRDPGLLLALAEAVVPLAAAATFANLAWANRAAILGSGGGAEG